MRCFQGPMAVDTFVTAHQTIVDFPDRIHIENTIFRFVVPYNQLLPVLRISCGRRRLPDVETGLSPADVLPN